MQQKADCLCKKNMKNKLVKLIDAFVDARCFNIEE